ncbi:DUF2489 domain-containing protein [Ketobacter sp. MCCC 1A13808]|uniref:DUF2489 domain-containing protein n=1 Tax=Ketobacter sp. MCCC 1A13808 TaxID=2602738 RepID=UPI000F1F87DE|nr:DUF2489 domain-containing protein [Ketobacter sp. MCCC 1A13808]MVF13281.1 DUF2489 domain-containing protein [Ketobacter sp. MCCC 1A13808]RLP54271.1 MAG: DUF2489 domain-containing protein [Ketobacter sp.]
MIWLFYGLAVVVVILATVAGWLWIKVWRLNQQQQGIQAQLAEQQAETEQNRLDYICESLNVIANAVLENQCPVTEGCIRMAVLLDNLPLDCDTKHRFSLIFEIYNATRHIPTHSGWKSLDRQSRQRYKQEMFGLEQKHNDGVMRLMTHVKHNPFGKGVGMSIN